MTKPKRKNTPPRISPQREAELQAELTASMPPEVLETATRMMCEANLAAEGMTATGRMIFGFMAMTKAAYLLGKGERAHAENVLPASLVPSPESEAQ